MAAFIVDPPEFGAETPAFRKSRETIELLARRRSTAADYLTTPGPTPEELNAILTIAARAPDHRRVTPFRFIVIEGEDGAKAGEILRAAYVAANQDATPERIEAEARRFLRAPVVIAVVSRVAKHHRTPEWEQVLTAGAVCQNMLVAASAYGFAAQWLTEWYAFDDSVAAGFGLVNDDETDERFAGFVYLGSASAPPKERARPDMAAISARFGDVTPS
ncbi:MAG: nitroreductase [Pseudomonadota bacterium]